MRTQIISTVLLLSVVSACSPSQPPSRNVQLASSATAVASVEPPPPESVAPNPPPPPAPPEPAPEPPDPATTLALGNDAEVVISLIADSSNQNPPTIALELRRKGKSVMRREGWDVITHFDLKKIHPCETWSTRPVREPLGTVNAVRFSLVCRTGEDYMTSSEIAVLVNPDDLSTIWSGLADTFSNSMDSCTASKHITFRIIPPKTLEKTIVEETNWQEQVIEESVKARLKRECKVGTKRRVERVALP